MTRPPPGRCALSCTGSGRRRVSMTADEPASEPSLDRFATELEALGREERARLGASDFEEFARLKWLSRTAEWAGRLSLICTRGPLSFCSGSPRSRCTWRWRHSSTTP